MATKKLNDVWKGSRQTGTHLLCLLSIADQASSQGYAWPSIRQVAGMCRVSPRQAVRLAAKCVEDGELYRHERPGKSNQWVVMVGTSRDDFLEVAEANLHMGPHEARQIYAVCQSRMQATATPDTDDRGTHDARDGGDVHDRSDIRDRGDGERGDIHDRGDTGDTRDIAMSVTPDTAMSPDPLITNISTGLDQQWQLVDQLLETSTTKDVYRHFSHARLIDVEEDGKGGVVIVLEAAHQRSADLINNRIGHHLLQVVQRVMGWNGRPLVVFARPPALSAEGT